MKKLKSLWCTVDIEQDFWNLGNAWNSTLSGEDEIFEDWAEKRSRSIIYKDAQVDACKLHIFSLFIGQVSYLTLFSKLGKVEVGKIEIKNQSKQCIASSLS